MPAIRGAALWLITLPPSTFGGAAPERSAERTGAPDVPFVPPTVADRPATTGSPVARQWRAGAGPGTTRRGGPPRGWGAPHGRCVGYPVSHRRSLGGGKGGGRRSRFRPIADKFRQEGS